MLHKHGFTFYNLDFFNWKTSFNDVGNVNLNDFCGCYVNDSSVILRKACKIIKECRGDLELHGWVPQ